MSAYNSMVPYRGYYSAQSRAAAVQDAAGHYGWHKFDSGPMQLTLDELKRRWWRYDR